MGLIRKSLYYGLNLRIYTSNNFCINCIRAKSSAEVKTKTYSHTILFPKTLFPTRSNNAIKEEVQKMAQFAELYTWQRENLKGPEFVLHDGPPYANGDLHMGHAVNKIIKDINNRSQILQGNKVHYVPGWDCHGLPIELKALQKAKKSSKNISSPVHIRQIARDFALETVAKQKMAFQSWGIMANWDTCYLTLNKNYVQNQLRQFYKMYKSGLIFRALKPVYWSPSSKTALAEAELEYDPQFKSKEVYVKFPLESVPVAANNVISGLLTSEKLPFLEASHVTEGKGTGLVHTAPAHGPDDFLVALKNNMTVECNVDESGRYINLGDRFDGLYVLGDGQDEVINVLEDSIIHKNVYIHSYPLDWRTKKPVIIRASQQWFIDTAALKDKALVKFTFSLITLKKIFFFFFFWFITFFIFTCLDVCHEILRIKFDPLLIEKLCNLIEKNNTDVWWTCDVRDLIPDDVRNKYNLKYEEVSKGNDIMDIWLDSGLSWQTLEGKRANLYSEGVDQLTGWFQTSLLTSLALTGEAPFKWWAASHSTQHSQIVISKKLLEDCQSEVIRIRAIIKYLLGVVSDMDKGNFVVQPKLNYFDQFIIMETYNFLQQIIDHYNNFRYNHAAQSILFFISNKVSSLYCHCIKDRLYCSAKDSDQRQSAQLTIHTILVALCKAIGPILPHLIEEAWQHHPLYVKPFYFTKEIPMLPNKNIDTSLMVAILEIKRDVCVLNKNENLKKFNLHLKLNSDLFCKLNTLNYSDDIDDSVLTEILEVSSVSLEEVRNGGKPWHIELSKSKKNQCLRCRKYNVLDNSDKCLRCESVVSAL
ncbi:Isoleucyl-tRNA synthetase [Papilio machaon]|uniref:isoleucine--tRNA ligase n=1 Tax=Papilio machaon TaxID=76193 RepID=A0A0N1PH05_PAPMA|nr:Isoleucyl-tRNA synthetase [Papilio machaon]